MSGASPLYWRRKLDAYLHDPLSKPTDIRGHEAQAETQRAVDLIQPHERFDKNSDFLAAAADRLPFPTARKLVAPFDGMKDPFCHPFAPDCPYQADTKAIAGPIDEISQQTRTILDNSDPRLAYLVRWRFWRLWTQWKQPASAFFPADTRIPDHSLWNHLSITSAFQGCIGEDGSDRPALLLFSIGPVQPLIAAARRIGDLWSGSYLLSYLIASALAEVSREFGPDHVLFPNLWGQPLLDLHLADDWQSARLNESHIEISGKRVRGLWEQIWQPDNETSRKRYLLPSVPNRFLALLPESRAADFARHLESHIRSTLAAIADSVATHLNGSKEAVAAATKAFFPERIESQKSQLLEIHWQTMSLPESVTQAEEWGRAHLPGTNRAGHPALQSVESLERMWKKMPESDRTTYGLKNPGSSWPIATALVSWALDSVKQTRAFEAWQGSGSAWKYGADQNKDDLTGREEMVLSVENDEEKAKTLGQDLGISKAAFRKNETLGTLSLIKRLWHETWLRPRHHFKPEEDFRMPDTHDLAAGRYEQREGPDRSRKGDEDGYLAVIALDGDEMGKWISGENNPPVGKLLARPAREYFEKVDPGFLEERRPMNPSFHLQFSEALSNFGLYAAGRIVEYHAGRLIYAGGDDVLALVPADRALDCTLALRRAFRGTPDADQPCDHLLFECHTGRIGFLRLKKGPDYDLADDYGLDPYCYDVLMPGPAADVSAGVAIGHAKSPIQDLVRQAQQAEKLAKNQLGRSAIALSIYKRSGEILEWGCPWEQPPKGSGENHPGLDLLQFLVEQLATATIEKRFPHKLIALLEPYFSTAAHGSSTCDPAFAEAHQEIIRREFEYCQREAPNRHLADLFARYLDSTTIHSSEDRPEAIARLEHLCGLLRTAGWMARKASARETHS